MALPLANIQAALEALLDNGEPVSIGLLDIDGDELAGQAYARVDFNDWITDGAVRKNNSPVEFPLIGEFEIGGVAVYQDGGAVKPFAFQIFGAPIAIGVGDQPRFVPGDLQVQVP